MSRGSGLACSFCGKDQRNVRKLIAGPAGYFICDACVQDCAVYNHYKRIQARAPDELGKFTEDAVEAIAEQALLRRTGARASRAVVEEVLLTAMYEVPSRDDVARVAITREAVLDNVNPTLVPREPLGEPPSRRRDRGERSA